MPSAVLEKMNRLSPQLKAKLSEAEFLSRLEALGNQYGVKEIMILLDLLLGEIAESELAGKLKSEYGFNDFLTQEVVGKFLALVRELQEKKVTPAPVPKKNNNNDAMAGMVFAKVSQPEITGSKTVQANNKIDYSKQAEKIIAESGYTADEVLLIRLKNIIIAKLRGVRDDLETLDNLVKNKKIGGLELSTEQAEKFLQLMAGSGNDLAQDQIIKPSHSGLADFNFDFGDDADDADETDDTDKTDGNQFAEKITAQKIAPNSAFRIEEEGGLPVVRMPDDLLVIPNTANQATLKVVTKITKELPPELKNDKINTAKVEAGSNIPSAPLPVPQPYDIDKKISTPQLTRSGNRPTLDGIKVERRLFGPIEELENLTMIDFRRISADPTIAVNKIKEKIDLLEAEGFEKKMAGINAWHKSEVNKFYRLLGQASMADGLPIEKIISNRLFSGKPTLSIDEFHAIMELNRSLRY